MASSNESLVVNRVTGNFKHTAPILPITGFSDIPRRTPKKLLTRAEVGAKTEERRVERGILKKLSPMKHLHLQELEQVATGLSKGLQAGHWYLVISRWKNLSHLNMFLVCSLGGCQIREDEKGMTLHSCVDKNDSLPWKLLSRSQRSRAPELMIFIWVWPMSGIIEG
jgi:hypothetical protein